MNAGAAMARPPPGSSRTARSTRTLRDAILSLQLAPGTRLVERELVVQLGVSRTGVRAALQALESESLVARGRRGVFSVVAVSPEEARQIYEVRAALEPAMARLFVQRASAAQIAELGAVVTQAEAAARARDGAAYVTAFRGFYAVLLAGSGNAVAGRILQTLDARITWLRHLTTQRASQPRQLRTVGLLRGIFAAVHDRNAAVAARRSAAFVVRSARFALDVLARQPAGPPP